jgi:putative serine/threonine protein kinase
MSVFIPRISDPVLEWLSSNHYSTHVFLARGRSGGVWLVEKNGKRFAAKIEHRKSRRMNMVEKEARLLQMANEVNVGPKLMEYNVEAGIIVMEYVDGLPLSKWIDGWKSKDKIKMVLNNLFEQAKRLDDAGLDHGQLGGKLHNILVDRQENVTIIDFEKASYVRKVRNVSKLREVLEGGYSLHSKKILSIWPLVEREMRF